jgi:hypothetical protein
VSAGRALTFLVARSAWNRVRLTLRRVRQPRYALAVAAWGLWLTFILANNLRAGRRAVGPTGEVSGVAALVLVTLGVVSVAVSWATGREQPLLALTQAEFYLLVPAPLSRRQLVAYRVLRSAAVQLLPMLLLGVLLGGGDAARRLMRGAGWWCASFALTLHLQAAGLTRAGLALRAVPWILRRTLGVAVAAAAVTALVLAFRSAPPPALRGEDVAAWCRTVLASPPLALGLYLFVAPVRLAVALDAPAFAAALPGALAVVGVHLAWLLALDVPFEERALENAGAAARRLGDVRAGMGLRVGGVRRSFRLAATGRPELALAWKSLVRARRFVSIQAVAFAGSAGLVVVALAVAAAFAGRASPVPVLALAAHPLTALLGPAAARGELRRGLGEVAALLPNPVLPGDPALRAAVVASLALGGLAITALGLVAQNGLAVTFPALAQPALEPGYSVERAGMGILLMLAGLSLLVLVFLPGLALGAGVYVLVRPLAGALTLPLATAAGTLPVFAATTAGLWLVGRAFEKGDGGE